MAGVTGLTNTAANSIVNVFSKKSGEAADSTMVISQGTRLTKASIDASSLALSEKLRSQIDVLSQANRNAAQGASVVQLAVGAQQNILNLLTSMKSLTAKSNDGSQNAQTRALINTEFQKLYAQVDKIADQARWNGVSLLNGGVGSASVAAAVAINVDGLGTVVANTFAAAPIDTTNSRGYITGMFSDASVKKVGNQFEISLTMKDATPGGEMTQVFTGTVAAPVAGASAVLVSTTDSKNQLVLTYAADVSGFDGTAATFQTNLKSALSVGTGLIGANVRSVATAVNNGIAASGDITASSSTPAGTYALEYFAADGVMKLTNGMQKYEVSMTASGAQTVNFANGVSVALAAGFATGTSITQIVFDVAPSASDVSMNFQVAEKATDTLNVQIAGATISSLGLTNANVLDQASAQSAGNKLDSALQALNNSIAKLGAQQKQLESASDNLKTSIENNVAARGVYNDADIPAEMGKLTQATVFSQLSQAMLTQALELQKGLVRLAQ